MDLFYEMLLHYNKRLLPEQLRQQVQLDAKNWVEMESFHALVKIKSILEDDSLRDDECFQKIEEIVCVFEDLGSGCGSRHDFG